MKRAILLTVVLAGFVWWSSRDHPREYGGLAFEGGADGAGAAVYVNGRSIGSMKPEWWVRASALDSGSVGKGRASGIASDRPRPDSALFSRLDARVQLRRLNEIVVVSARGVRLVSLAPLGESTLVWVSFAARRLTVTPAGAGATQAEADTLVEVDD
jgi:hypothetical protein